MAKKRENQLNINEGMIKQLLRKLAIECYATIKNVLVIQPPTCKGVCDVLSKVHSK